MSPGKNRNTRSKLNKGKRKTTNEQKTLQLQYEMLLNEYRVANDQILHRLEIDDRNYDWTMVTIGVIVAASSVVINYKIYGLLLILSLPFHILIWEQVRRSLTGTHLAKYITQELSPRIKAVMEAINPPTHQGGGENEIITWEGYVSGLFQKNTMTKFVMSLPKTGKAGLQFGLAIMLSGLYLYLRIQDPQYAVSPLDILLFVINLIATLFTIASLAFLRTRR